VDLPNNADTIATCTKFTSNQNLQLFMLYGRLVHVGETFNMCRFWTENCIQCVWRPGFARTRWMSYSAPPDPVGVIRGNGEREGE